MSDGRPRTSAGPLRARYVDQARRDTGFVVRGRLVLDLCRPAGGTGRRAAAARRGPPRRAPSSAAASSTSGCRSRPGRERPLGARLSAADIRRGERAAIAAEHEPERCREARGVSGRAGAPELRMPAQLIDRDGSVQSPTLPRTATPPSTRARARRAAGPRRAGPGPATAAAAADALAPRPGQLPRPPSAGARVGSARRRGEGRGGVRHAAAARGPEPGKRGGAARGVCLGRPRRRAARLRSSARSSGAAAAPHGRLGRRAALLLAAARGARARARSRSSTAGSATRARRRPGLQRHGRIMRLPGTFNQKRGQWCRILRADRTARRSTRTGSGAALPDPDPPRPPRPRADNGSQGAAGRRALADRSRRRYFRRSRRGRGAGRRRDGRLPAARPRRPLRLLPGVRRGGARWCFGCQRGGRRSTWRRCSPAGPGGATCAARRSSPRRAVSAALGGRARRRSRCGRRLRGQRRLAFTLELLPERSSGEVRASKPFGLGSLLGLAVAVVFRRMKRFAQSAGRWAGPTRRGLVRAAGNDRDVTRSQNRCSAVRPHGQRRLMAMYFRAAKPAPRELSSVCTPRSSVH